MVLESQTGEFVFFYHKCGCLCCKGLIEKESVDSKGARGRVSKFYKWYQSKLALDLCYYT